MEYLFSISQVRSQNETKDGTRRTVVCLVKIYFGILTYKQLTLWHIQLDNELKLN